MNDNQGYDPKMLRAVNPMLSTEKYRHYIDIIFIIIFIIYYYY